jgi:hypothetical protein
VLSSASLRAIIGIQGPAQRFGPKAMRSAARMLRDHCLAMSQPSGSAASGQG